MCFVCTLQSLQGGSYGVGTLPQLQPGSEMLAQRGEVKVPKPPPVSQTCAPFKSTMYKDSVAVWEPPVLHSFLPLFFFLKCSGFVITQPHNVLLARKGESMLHPSQSEHCAAPFITVSADSSPQETLLVGGGRDAPFILSHFDRRIDSASRHRQLLKTTNILTFFLFFFFLVKMLLILSRYEARKNRPSVQTEKRCFTISTNRVFNFSRSMFFTKRKIPSNPSNLISQLHNLENEGLYEHCKPWFSSPSYQQDGDQALLRAV